MLSKLKLDHTPITTHKFGSQQFFLKRDDLLHPHFSGNKARKLMALLEGDFPHVKTIIGYGSPQSNLLYSFAGLGQLKGWNVEFYVDHIPALLKSNPTGNYKAALELGAQVIDVSEIAKDFDYHVRDYIEYVRIPGESDLFIPEGGRSPIAESGVKGLAEEIRNWALQNQVHNLTVALPSGTGTTSLYLHKHLKAYNIEVITCACVGGKQYLTEQFNELNELSHPEILSVRKLSSPDKHHFGKLYFEDYQMWYDLNQRTNVEFELVYDPYMWQCLLPWFKQNQDRNLLYVHQGGLLGNESMLPRYIRKYGEL